MVALQSDEETPAEKSAFDSSDIEPADLLQWLQAIEARLDRIEAFVISQALLARRHMLSLVANIEKHVGQSDQ